MAPGADPDQIKLAFEGASDIQVADSGDLLLATALGEVRVQKPLVYQLDPATARLTTNNPPHAVVPHGAGPRHLAFHPNGKFVYVINDNVVNAKTVTVTQQNETIAVIASGITVEDRVVTTGFANLSEGARVAICARTQTDIAAAGHDPRYAPRPATAVALPRFDPDQGRLALGVHAPRSVDCMFVRR